MLAAAEAAGRRIGSAPDTVLGTGIQTARRLIDDGEIGQPIAATAFMMSPGHESWHPDPDFYYLRGGGPLLDMGVYYLTALVTLLGPVAAVSAMSSRLRTERRVPDSGPRAGEILPVEVDTYVAATLRHDSGVISTLIVSFDTIASQLPRIEVYGSAASLDVPDPNQFANPVGISRDRTEPFAYVCDLGGYPDAGRGYGLSDLARAIGEGAPHRQSAELGFHVHEVMERIAEASAAGATVRVVSRCDRPAAVPQGATRRSAEPGPVTGRRGRRRRRPRSPRPRAAHATKPAGRSTRGRARKTRIDDGGDEHRVVERGGEDADDRRVDAAHRRLRAVGGCGRRPRTAARRRAAGAGQEDRDERDRRAEQAVAARGQRRRRGRRRT